MINAWTGSINMNSSCSTLADHAIVNSRATKGVMLMATQRCKVCLPNILQQCQHSVSHQVQHQHQRISVNWEKTVPAWSETLEEDIVQCTMANSSNLRLFRCDRTTRHLTGMKNAVAVRQSITRWVMSCRMEDTIQWCYLQRNKSNFNLSKLQFTKFTSNANRQ